jgi:hypothetical protein
MPRQCGSGFWIGVEPNRTIIPIQIHTAGCLLGPVANTSLHRRNLHDFSTCILASTLLIITLRYGQTYAHSYLVSFPCDGYSYHRDIQARVCSPDPGAWVCEPSSVSDIISWSRWGLHNGLVFILVSHLVDIPAGAFGRGLLILL